MNFMTGLYAVEPRCVAMSAMGDIDEIKQVKYRYLRALDTKHWDDFADTLTEDVVGRYGESIGEEHHFSNRDELVTFMRSSLGPGDHHRAPCHAPGDHCDRR
jgi:hypothetical protein